MAGVFTRTLFNWNVHRSIDLTSLTEAFNANIPLARLGRCQAPLKNLPAESIRSVDAAAQFRLRQKRIAFATRSTCTDATKRFQRSQPRSVTRKTSCRSHFTQRLPLQLLRENVEDCERCSLAQRVSQAPDLDIYKNRRANIVNCGIAGGRTAMIWSD